MKWVMKSMNDTAIVIPNLNGITSISECVDSLLGQTLQTEVIVVENGSTDGSRKFLEEKYPNLTLLVQDKNYGFAGGVNIGIRYALQNGFKYIGLLNNDAVADKHWLENLRSVFEKDPKIGIATCKLMSIDKKSLDSTGDFYTFWGLPYPRGRGEAVTSKYDNATDVFAGSGGASLYSAEMFRAIGLFDEDFFAYYEDVDISFRAQLTGWKVVYVPDAIAYHQIGKTSGKMKGFTTFQTMKNLPMLAWKNLPLNLLPKVLPKFFLAYSMFYLRAWQRGLGIYATKGAIYSLYLFPKKTLARRKIQKSRTVSKAYIASIITRDLPPNAKKLRHLRAGWQKLTKRV